MKILHNPSFDAFFQPYWIRRVLKDNLSCYTGTLVYRLVAGCVKLEVILCRESNTTYLGYDVYVKAKPMDYEWILYDTLREPADATAPDMQQEMCRVLANYMKENSLSCMENHFEEIEKENDDNG